MTLTTRSFAAMFAALAMLTLWVPTLADPATHSAAHTAATLVTTLA